MGEGAGEGEGEETRAGRGIGLEDLAIIRVSWLSCIPLWISEMTLSATTKSSLDMAAAPGATTAPHSWCSTALESPNRGKNSAASFTPITPSLSASAC